MEGSQQKKTRRRFHGRGKGPGNAQNHTQAGQSSQRASQGGMSNSPAGGQSPGELVERVLTPPLTEAIPEDTPRFADLADTKLVDAVLLQTIKEDMKFDHMTPVQAATIHQLLTDRQDILAQAKTGTGKTVAFLLPAIQTMLNKKRKPGQSVSLLVISPTRELALQIAKEAQSLLQRLGAYRVCVAIGGTNKDSEEKKILQGCDILIGTPGRLFDHFSGEKGGSTPVAEKMQSLDTLVLDEADRLLDMGFLPSLKDIIKRLPDRQTTNRQSMLFSATVPDHVEKVAHFALSKQYKFISTIPQGEANTHERVPQHLLVVPTFSDMAAGLIGAMRKERALVGADKFKAIVFGQTAAQVDFYASILDKTELGPVLTLHSRMTQSKRGRQTQDFRQAKKGILVATDVIARGMDFPSVTNVFQAGIPSDRESYIHRLGRTARAGAEGRGTFIITEHERAFPKYTLKDIALEETEQPDLSALKDVEQITAKMDTQEKTYQAWLGFYKTHVKVLRWDLERLVSEANTYAIKGLGAADVPPIYKTTVGKMGLKGVKGLKVVPNPPKVGNNNNRRGE